MSVTINTLAQTYQATVTLTGDYSGEPSTDFEVALGDSSTPGVFLTPDAVTVNGTTSVTLMARLGNNLRFDPIAGTYWLWGRDTNNPDVTLVKDLTRITVVTTQGHDIPNALQFAQAADLTTESTARANGDAALSTELVQHINDTGNPHVVTKAQVGLGNVDNTSDANKPVSTAQDAAFLRKTDASNTYDPIGSGSTAQTAAASDAATKVATHAGSATAHARLQVTDVFINRTGSGPPNDSMFTSPTDGMEYVDTLNSRKYVRVGGSWVFSSLGTSGAFTPASVSGLVAWYDASQITGLSDGASVAQWNDLSGNGNHLTAAGAAQPVYKTAIQNGKPVVRFNGTASVMSKTLTSALVAPYTVILVGRASQGTSASECFFSGANSTYLEGRSSGKYGTQSGTPTFAQLNTGTKLNAFVCLVAIFSTTPAVRVNGVELDGTWSSCANLATIYLGAVNGSADWLNGDVAEVMVYNRALTNTEIVNIENYLS